MEDAQFLGHPRGLAYLAFTQAWERFSFYGMQALLTLYMIHHLLLPGQVEHVIGFEGFRRGLEAVFGPLSTVALASQIFGLYAGSIYLTPLIGALLGDGPLGQRRTVVLGLLLMGGGHALMALEATFLFALVLLMVGAGCIKGNMYDQVGNLYREGDARRTTAFSIFLIGLNVGAFLAPLVCGTLGEVYGWHYGFGAAALGMLVGIAIYVSGFRYLPPDRRRAAGPRVPLSREDWRSIGVMGLVLLPLIPISSAAFQAYGLLIVWAETHMDRVVLGWTFPVTWLLSFDGVMTILGILATFPVWRWLKASGRYPGTTMKFAVAGLLVTLGYAVIATGAAVPGLVPVAVVLLYFALIDTSYAWMDPPGNSFVSRFSPAPVATTLMSVNLMLTAGVPYFTAGWLGRFYEPLGPVRFWWLHAAIAAGGTVLALALSPLVRRQLRHHPQMTAPGAAPA